ncbi:RNA-directed DNA polymerase from mobile element jockey [Toxocara canis]|uniref:RNA-directed DNA polymerase from mobile element jockey n=1 Tax=Toxocara canis TaxID=6265 RepID=A0A0B2VVA2_TOXCA|nr:RNA-directed DNA polymerase from mobile element jockey [Toxocara canis]
MPLCTSPSRFQPTSQLQFVPSEELGSTALELKRPEKFKSWAVNLLAGSSVAMKNRTADRRKFRGKEKRSINPIDLPMPMIVQQLQTTRSLELLSTKTAASNSVAVLEWDKSEQRSGRAKAICVFAVRRDDTCGNDSVEQSTEFRNEVNRNATQSRRREDLPTCDGAEKKQIHFPESNAAPRTQMVSEADHKSQALSQFLSDVLRCDMTKTDVRELWNAENRLAAGTDEFIFADTNATQHRPYISMFLPSCAISLVSADELRMRNIRKGGIEKNGLKLDIRNSPRSLSTQAFPGTAEKCCGELVRGTCKSEFFFFASSITLQADISKVESKKLFRRVFFQTAQMPRLVTTATTIEAGKDQEVLGRIRRKIFLEAAIKNDGRSAQKPRIHEVPCEAQPIPQWFKSPPRKQMKKDHSEHQYSRTSVAAERNELPCWGILQPSVGIDLLLCLQPIPISSHDLHYKLCFD